MILSSSRYRVVVTPCAWTATLHPTPLQYSRLASAEHTPSTLRARTALLPPHVAARWLFIGAMRRVNAMPAIARKAELCCPAWMFNDPDSETPRLFSLFRVCRRHSHFGMSVCRVQRHLQEYTHRPAFRRSVRSQLLHNSQHRKTEGNKPCHQTNQ